ncbi:MAG TPA: PAN/Apple domain-containing protein [Hyphomicrobiaceae bacterium]|nr:PAN/Apple domain-containing protein [Hyphomicrobiaceae bacterium]
MFTVRQVGVGLVIVGIALTVQGCWEKDEDRLTLLGDGGCRTADGGDGSPTYISGVSLEGCKQHCFGNGEPCAAIEFNSNNSMCEVHSEAITRVEPVEGVACYVLK